MVKIPKANAEIRRAKEEAGVPYWLIAHKLNIHEVTLNKRLRFELPADQKQEILSVIRELRDGEQSE